MKAGSLVLLSLIQHLTHAEGGSPGHGLRQFWLSVLGPSPNELSTLLFVNSDQRNPATLSDDPEKLKSLMVVLMSDSEKQKVFCMCMRGVRKSVVSSDG